MHRSEFRIVRTDGSVRWVSVLGDAERDAEGNALRVMGVTMEVTERKHAEEELARNREHLEEQVRERTLELQTANRELEAFSYSVSHDLRAPLRAVDGFSRALMDDYADVLDEDGMDSLNCLREASQNMGRLIDDLLALSRVSREAMHTEEVDLGVIAELVIAELRGEHGSRRVEFSSSGDLRASGDPRLLRVVMENLLGNAWKFTRKVKRARVELGTTEKDGRTVYFVRDNGAGFDMVFADKLFSPFQRLHRVDEFEGSGIGLATVQRIIRRHGGDEWGEGEADRGAAFYFTLA